MSTSTDLVSVVIPTYNRARLLSKAIQSVLDQTYPNWELVVVDDGSTDDTAEVVASFEPHVTYIQQNNAGACAARNTGLRAARGAYVLFLDSDDLLLPRNLERLVRALDRHPGAGVAYGWYYWIEEDGSPSKRGGPQQGTITNGSPWPDAQPIVSGTRIEGQIFEALCLEETILMGASLMRRSCVEAVGGFDETVDLMEHWDLFLRIAHAGYAYTCVPEPVAMLRFHAGNRGQDHGAMLHWRLHLIDRLLDDADPAEHRLKRQSHAAAYATKAWVHYRGGDSGEGAPLLREALARAPLHGEHHDNYVRLFAQQAVRAERPLLEVERVFRPLLGPPHAKRLKRAVLCRVHRQLAQRAGREHGFLDWTVWHHAGRAVVHNPRLLLTYAKRAGRRAARSLGR